MRGGNSSRGKAMNLFVPGGNGNAAKIESSSPVIPSFTPSFSPVDKTQDMQPESVQAEEVLPADEIKTEDLIDNADAKIALANAHNEALGVLNKAIKRMGQTIEDIDPEKLPSAVNSVTKVVESIRRERLEAGKAKSGKDVHLHFYTPVQKALTDYEIVEVG